MTKKSLFITVLLAMLALIIITSVGFATETRLLSMGGIPYIRDNSNVFYFPATINQYPNQAIAELRLKDGGSDNSIGIHLPVMSESVLGVYLNQPFSVPLDMVSQITSNIVLKNAIAVIYGKKMSNFDVGLLLTLVSDSWENSTTKPKIEESARVMNIGAGISSPTYDLGVLLNLPSISRKADPAEEKYSGLGVDIHGRYFMKKTETLELIPLARLGFGSASYADDSGIEGTPKGEVDLSSMNLELGVGMSYQVNETNLAVLGLELFGMAKNSSEVKDSYKNTTTTRTLPALYVGVESNLKPWLIGRLGASQAYYKTTSKYEPKQGENAESSSNDSSFNLSFGFGIKVAGFLLDAHFNENLFFDGPNFISGQRNSIANRISVTYNF